MSTGGIPATRGRPRDERITEEAIQAALAILSADGGEPLSIEAVARRARISRPAIYKRWPSLADLVLDVAVRARDELMAGNATVGMEMVDTGSLSGDLAAYIATGMNILDQLDRVRITRPLLAESIRSRSLAARVAEELFAGDEELLRQIFARAEARGEIVPGQDVRAIFHALAGFAHFRKYLLDLPIDDGSVNRLCALLVKGMRHASGEG